MSTWFNEFEKFVWYGGTETPNKDITWRYEEVHSLQTLIKSWVKFLVEERLRKGLGEGSSDEEILTTDKKGHETFFTEKWKSRPQ